MTTQAPQTTTGAGASTEHAPVPQRSDETPGGVARLLAVTALLAGLSYSLWVWSTWLNPRLNPLQSYVSELSARDQPHADLFAAADVTSAVLITLLALGALAWLPRRPWAAAGWSLQLGFGVVSIADAFSRLDCAPSATTACALRERAGFVSDAHKAHADTSTLAILLILPSMLTLIVAARRYVWWPAGARRLAYAVLAVELTTSILTLVLAVAGWGLGISERIQVGTVSLWYLLLAAMLWPSQGTTSSRASL